MTNFNQSTQEMIGYVGGGLRVETSTLANATYLLTGGTATDCFNVYGRILVTQLYLEAITAFSAHATVLFFYYDASTPALASNPMCAACASVSGLGQGTRVVYVGGAVATAAVITDSAGLSDVTCVTPHIVGGHEFIGTIGVNSGTASQLSGTFRMIMHYLPYSDGAYAEAAL